MNPYDKVMLMYSEAGEVEVSLSDMIACHVHNGMLVSTHDVFLACRLVRSSWSDEDHLDISKVAFRDEADCWMVWMASGSMAEMMALLAKFPLPWVSFSRGDSRKVTRISSERLYGITLQKAKEAESSSASASTSG
jgi:hypothetical protein